MAQRFKMACIYAWDHIVAKRRYNRIVEQHSLPWLREKAKIDIDLKILYSKIRGIEEESWEDLE